MRTCLNRLLSTAPTVPRAKSLASVRVQAGLLAALAFAQSATAQNGYLQHNLVSDVAGQADITDTNLVNPWGIAFSATSPFWISDNHTGLSTLYNSAGTPQSLIVTIPPPNGGSPPAAPTGVVFNSTSGFQVSTGASSRFIFATEDGTIVGWNSGTNGVGKVDNSAAGAIYKGLAIATASGATYLYAADFHNGKIDVFDANFSPANLPGSFADPNIPAGYAPFNVQAIHGVLYVTYALQDQAAEDDVPGPGNGYVNLFDTSGNLVKRLVSGGTLNSPWGLAMAPDGFGVFAGALLVGNFGDGSINAFDPETGNSLGAMVDSNGAPISISGLWALAFGNGGNGGDPHTLYFTAGPLGETHGLFGSISAVAPAFTAIADKGLATGLSWAGGSGTFLVQKKASLAQTNWQDVLTTQNHDLMVAKNTMNGFLRLQAQATNTALPFTVLLSGDSENPAVTTGASGIGTLTLEGTNLTYEISFSGLSAPATAGHIHAPGVATSNAPVVIPFTVPKATSGTVSGTTGLTPDQLSYIAGGLAYVNFHTTNNPLGEIRGQIVPLRIAMSLNGASEVPPVPTGATAAGSLTLVGNQLYYDITYSGVQGGATAAHIHGPADTTNSASVLVPLKNPTGTSGNINGAVSLTPLEMRYLLSGLTYVNIHSVSNALGEIRGQILPIQLGASLSGANEPQPDTSRGSGTAVLSILNNLLTYSVTFTNLLSPATAAHIHGPGGPGQNVPVLIPFAPPATTSGTISGTAELTTDKLIDLLSGLTYVNIHTTNYPGGEIRGQVLPRN